MDITVKLLIPFHFGDVFTVCGFKDAFQEKHNVKVKFIIKPEHEVIMKLFEINDYEIREFSNIDTENYVNIAEEQYSVSNGSDFICLPKKADWEDFYAYKINIRELFAKSLLLDKSAKWKSPTYIPELTEELKKKIKNIAPFNKIILFSPECFATYPVLFEAYKDDIDELTLNGYKVISSVKDEKSTIPGTIYIPLNFYEALAVSINCAGVYCVRSGFTDVVIEYVNKITIYYPDRKTYNLFNFNYLSEKSVKEFIVQGIYKQKIIPFVDIEKTNYSISLNFSLNIFFKKKKRNKVTFGCLGIPFLTVRISKKVYRYFLFGFIKIYEVDKV